MADNPILDNTKALEEMIAALKAQQAPTNAPLPVASMYRSIDTLTRSMQELARVYAQGATPGSLAAQYARRQVERRRREVGERFGQLGPQGQVATMPVMRAMQEVEQRRKTPPLGDTISELQKRLDAYQNLREQGAEPGSLAAKAARAKIAEQEKLVGRSFGNLSPQQQAMALPAMQALEQQRQAQGQGPSLSRHLDELKARMDAYQNLRDQGASSRSLAAQAARSKVSEQEKLVRRQFGNLSPQQQEMALPAMQAMEQQRKQIEEEELKRRKQFTDEAKHGSSTLSHFNMGVAIAGASVAGLVNRTMDLARAADPSSISTFKTSIDIAKASAGQALGLPEGFRDWSRFLQGTSGKINEESRSGSVLARMFQSAGQSSISGLLPFLTPKGDYKENLFMPMRSRITTGEEYEQGLANAALESSGESADLKLIQEQMRNSNMLLREIVRNTGGANSPLFGN